MIQVTKTFLPPKEEYHRIIQEIWESNQIANGGLLHSRLQQELKKLLNIPNIILTANGTLPLQISLKSLAKGGKVITTPFSYVATTSSIVWENCTPVFVDIHPEYLTINEEKIEAVITRNTTAILVTHVFGNPCNVEAIAKIAEKHNLKVIYDAAHAFGVNYKGESIFNYGDVSTCSFHATKLFHTGEGGAMFCKDEILNNELFYSHNFGHRTAVDFQGLGINAKMNELQAGMGLAVLPYVSRIMEARKQVVNTYDKSLDFEKLNKLIIREGTEWNYSYYPVIFKDEKTLLEVKSALNKENVFPRRYFYPSLNTLNYVEYSAMKISQDISNRIMCLPLYSGLKMKEVAMISGIINDIIDK
ncbi:DegT/DnrJ/EryC1/StrS family aminotransferase [Salegentibacter chungangensis]|uniref:DegT/DnrJ/EryC1/StrS family aminotransferase n=1 Tax=Salegentibacter chungangensis TaxID=1335724 RepID=A0ABW3NV16_9FLAO